MRLHHMKNKTTKVIMGAIALLLLPMITVALLSSMYILIHLIQGSSFSSVLQSLKMIVENTKPYLPYITFVPMTIAIIVVVLKILIRKIRS